MQADNMGQPEMETVGDESLMRGERDEREDRERRIRLRRKRFGRKRQTITSRLRSIM